MLQLWRVGRPAQRGERHQRRREPRVEHIVVTREGAGMALGRGLGAGILFGAGDVDVAGFVIPRRNLVAPPQLARDAPVLDVVQPLVVGVDPLLGHQLDLAALHRVQRHLGDRAAGEARAIGGRLAHGDEPLVGQHRLDDDAGAIAARHHQRVLLHLGQQAQRFQVHHDALAGFEAVLPAIGGGRGVGDLRLQRQHRDLRQVVALADGVVVEVVARGHLDHAGAEFTVDVRVADDGDLAPLGGVQRIGLARQRQAHGPADQVGVALVFRVHHDGRVAQHGFRAGGGDGQVREAGLGIRLRQRIADVPQRAFLFLAHHFQVGHGGAQYRVPVDQTFAAVDQALFVEAHEHVADRARHLRVHREVLVLPVDRGTHAADLPGDGRARLRFPFPDLVDEGRAAQVMARDALRVQLALHHDLRGDAGVVGARHPQRVGALHARVARQAVHDGLVEGVPHVQRARYVRRRQLDAEIRAAGFERRAGDAHRFPRRAPLLLDGGGFETLGEGLVRIGHAGKGRKKDVWPGKKWWAKGWNYTACRCPAWAKRGRWPV